MAEIAKASRQDIPWLLRHDPHVGEEWVRRCIDLGEYLLARDDGDPFGFLRFSHFWGRIPYMEMIWVVPAHRRSGVGTALFRRWEEDMQRQGARMLMTSSEADEAAPQDWHRRNGFSPSGSLGLPGIQPGPESFFIKQIA